MMHACQASSGAKGEQIQQTVSILDDSSHLHSAIKLTLLQNQKMAIDDLVHRKGMPSVLHSTS